MKQSDMKREQPFYIVRAYNGDPRASDEVWRGFISSTPSQAWADATNKYGLAVGTMLNEYYHSRSKEERDSVSSHYIYPKQLRFLDRGGELILLMHEVQAEATATAIQ